MTEKGPLEITEEKGWNEMMQFAKEAEEIVEEYGDTVFGYEQLQQMIVAIRERNIVLLRRLADGSSFPYRRSIQDALKLFKPVQS